MFLPSRQVLLALTLTYAQPGVADVTSGWSGELRNLDFDSLTVEEVQQLSSGYAQDVATSLGVDIMDVLDMNGHAGQMTLSSLMTSSDPSPSPSPQVETTSTTTLTMTTTMTTTLTRAPSMRPLRGIAYSALPCTSLTCGGRGLPSKDVAQTGYEQQWGAAGRDDLGTMAKLGANTVRLYNILGLHGRGTHAGFLDHANDLGLSVMPGFDTAQVTLQGECPQLDCFDTWKKAALRGFQNGFQHGSSWHPAVSTLLLMNEPDAFDQIGKCQPYGDWCRVKAVLSAMDGVLAAEREAGVAPGQVKLAVTWSFASRTSLDGNVTGPGIFGFQDMVAAIANPQLAKYSPRTEHSLLEQAFRTRWVHGVNTRSPWSFVDEMVSAHFAKFRPVPWFIGEYGAVDESESALVIQQNLEAMDRRARDGGDFLGVTFFQFQTSYQRGGVAKNFGLFALGDRVIGDTGKVCDRSTPCAIWPVHCLTTDLTWLSGTRAHRAQALAAAWGGSVDDSVGLCSHQSVEPVSTSASPVVSQTTSTQFVVTTPKKTEGMPPLQPLRGIAYGALPCTTHGCGSHGMPSEDMLQVGYKKQWGAAGRDDLGIMVDLGANAVRLYHSLGLGVQQDHGDFLDYAESLNLNVMPGYHTENANDHAECPEFDCYDTWKAATLQGFEHGFKKEDGWHPAIATLVLLNEPDFFETAPKCQPPGAWCRVKAALSALDGVLAAEKEAGVAGRVKLTVTWSFAERTSIDGEVTGPGTYGFQDIVAGIRNPQIASYSPRASPEELQTALQTRWVHGLNTQAPWSFVKEVVSKSYARFMPTPWFIGEYGANGQPEATIQADLMSMQQFASERGSTFLGSAFFQFQTTYWKGGAEMNFGLFGLQDTTLGDTGAVCDKVASGCRPWPVHCLTSDLSWIEGSKAYRARAVASAWHGAVDSARLCGGRRLADTHVGTKLACQIRGLGPRAVSEELGKPSFSSMLLSRSRQVLGTHSDVVNSDIRLEHINVDSIEKEQEHGFPKWGMVFAIILAIVVSVALVVCLLRRKLKSRQGSQDGGAQPDV